MDKELKDLLDDYIKSFLNQETVKRYFILEEKINNDENIISLQNKLRAAQKDLALSLNNESYPQKKEYYLSLKNEFDNNPLVCNYNILKEEIYNQLMSLKEKLK